MEPIIDDIFEFIYKWSGPAAVAVMALAVVYFFPAFVEILSR